MLRPERRAHRRAPSSRYPVVTGVRLRSGSGASLLNLSSGGLLLETAARLAPGAAVEVLLKVESAERVIRARVARCFVASIDPEGELRFKAALEFDRPLEDAESWLQYRAGTTRPPLVMESVE